MLHFKILLITFDKGTDIKIFVTIVDVDHLVLKLNIFLRLKQLETMLLIFSVN